VNYPVRGFVLRPIEENAELGDIYSSISFVAGTITNYLLEKLIPHNLIVADKGLTIYIIPRQHEDTYKIKSLRCAWLEIAGLALCRDEETYNTLTKKGFEEILTNHVSLTEKEFGDIREHVIGVFKKNYE
jgi:ATP adenylyltransferase/5',5'''-P-1,P-4-tetraphosphate phosphorylase II